MTTDLRGRRPAEYMGGSVVYWIVPLAYTSQTTGRFAAGAPGPRAPPSISRHQFRRTYLSKRLYSVVDTSHIVIQLWKGYPYCIKGLVREEDYMPPLTTCVSSADTDYCNVSGSTRLTTPPIPSKQGVAGGACPTRNLLRAFSSVRCFSHPLL